MKKKVVLIGSGVSGLSCLYFFLKQSAHKIGEVEIFEKKDCIGGVLAHTQKNGFLLEHGAQGVLSSRTNFSALVAELNLSSKLSKPSEKTARSFFFKNRIVRISPFNIIQMFRLNLFSFSTLFQILGGFSIRRGKKIKSSNGKSTDLIHNNETVESFFIRRFGKGFTKNFVAPVMKGIWGGGMSRILVRFAFPSLVSSRGLTAGSRKIPLDPSIKPRNDKKTLLSFENGMLTLPQKILENIQDICAKKGVFFKLNLNESMPVQHEFDLLIYSGQPWLEPHSLCSLSKVTTPELKLQCQKALDVLKKIPTHSLVVVGIGSSNHEIKTRLDGFGALAVENNVEGVLGVITVHSLQDKHVPKDSFLYRVIMGGENIPEHVNLESCSDMELIKLAKQYLQKYHLLNKDTKYAFEEVVRHINYLPLPTLYQEQVIQAVNTLEHLIPGVFFAGNYLLGPAVDDCIAQARITAQKMLEHLK